ncbi:cupredoxin domain-containing protein [Bacillus massilinigeriensis]|uniref:hypothetical protein n=1 Tax=Bacillus mediterraneensis TaxID=1805474 RepID=UPI0008F8128C|nr:hypothetical protein [Bacillus mediterraneensis]
MHFLVIQKKQLTVIIFVVCIVLAALWLWNNYSTVAPVSKTTSEDKIREIHMVTGEFKSQKKDGSEIEAYRWDPGTIFLNKNERTRLKILGINGEEHPFAIEGTSIRGVVKKGEETVVPLEFKEEGVYRLICYTHPDKENNGPMIAYIVVD